jgi:general secretion pathway protein D
MHKLLAPLLLLVPALALAQVPLRPPGPYRRDKNQRPSPAARPTTPAAPAPGRPIPPRAPALQQPQGEPPETAPETAGEAGEAETTLAPANARCKPLAGRFMLSFNKAEITDVLEQASRWTCRNFIYTEDVARGKITLLSKTPVTAEEAYAAFLAALNANNIVVYPTGKYYSLKRSPDAKKLPIPTYVDADSGTPANEQIVTKVIRLQYADADQLRGVLGNFISPQGADIQSIPPDTLIITDIGLNIRRIERMLVSIDRAGAGDLIRLVQIRYASAKDIADKVNQIFQAQQGGRPGTRRGFAAAPSTPGRGRPAAAPVAEAGEVSITKVLPDERTNKLIVIADEKSYQRLMELIEQLDVPTGSDGGIHVVFLKNANAEELSTTLSNLAQGQAKRPGAAAVPAPAPALGGPAPQQRTAAVPAAGTAAVTAELFSGEVKVTADKTQNALLVQASGADFVAISRLIEKLDRPRRQVFVEAVILEVNLRDQRQLGVGAHTTVNLDYKGDQGVLPLVSAPGRISSLSPQNVIALGGFLTGFVGPTSAELEDLGLKIPSIGVLIQALQTSSDVNVISTPTLLAMDNEESEIAVGQNVPFQAGFFPSGISNLLNTSSTSSSAVGSLIGSSGVSSLAASIQRQNVELRLKIKPQINEGGNVRLLIEEQTEEIASTDPTLGPTTSKRSVKTQIVAKDQSTIVIGGLIQDRHVRSVNKIPFLGSLPLIGVLFRDTDTTKQKTNLLLFLTPHIIRDEGDYRRIYEKRRKEQQEFIEQFYGRQPGYSVDVDFSRKAGPYARMSQGVEEETQRLQNGGPGLPGEKLTAPPGGPDAAKQTPAPPVPVPVPVPVPAPPGGPATPGNGTPLGRDVPAPPPGEGEPVDRLDVEPEVQEPGAEPPAPEQAAPPEPPEEPLAPPGQEPAAPQGSEPAPEE